MITLYFCGSHHPHVHEKHSQRRSLCTSRTEIGGKTGMSLTLHNLQMKRAQENNSQPQIFPQLHQRQCQTKSGKQPAQKGKKSPFPQQNAFRENFSAAAAVGREGRMNKPSVPAEQLPLKGTAPGNRAHHSPIRVSWDSTRAVEGPGGQLVTGSTS